MLTGAAAKLRAAGLQAIHEVALRYAGLPAAAQLELLVAYAVELSDWHDRALAAVAFLIERPNGSTTIH